jgi:hypothetical protein
MKQLTYITAILGCHHFSSTFNFKPLHIILIHADEGNFSVRYLTIVTIAKNGKVSASYNNQFLQSSLPTFQCGLFKLHKKYNYLSCEITIFNPTNCTTLETNTLHYNILLVSLICVDTTGLRHARLTNKILQYITFGNN